MSQSQFNSLLNGVSQKGGVQRLDTLRHRQRPEVQPNTAGTHYTMSTTTDLGQYMELNHLVSASNTSASVAGTDPLDNCFKVIRGLSSDVGGGDNISGSEGFGVNCSDSGNGGNGDGYDFAEVEDFGDVFDDFTSKTPKLPFIDRDDDDSTAASSTKAIKNSSRISTDTAMPCFKEIFQQLDVLVLEYQHEVAQLAHELQLLDQSRDEWLESTYMMDSTRPRDNLRTLQRIIEHHERHIHAVKHDFVLSLGTMSSILGLQELRGPHQ